MGFFKKFALASLVFVSCHAMDKEHVAYLMQSKEIDALDLSLRNLQK